MQLPVPDAGGALVEQPRYPGTERRKAITSENIPPYVPLRDDWNCGLAQSGEHYR